MAVTGISSSSDLASLNAQMVAATEDYTELEKKAMRPASIYTQDQIQSYARSAQAMGEQIFNLAVQINAIISSQPKLPSPRAQSIAEVGTNEASLQTNGWLAPSAVMAFIAAMQYFLKSEARNEGMEGQNVSRSMTMTQQLGSSEAALQKKQGALEMEKAWFSAGIQIASATVTFATVAKRTVTMSRGATSAKAKALDDEAKVQQEKNDVIINKREADNLRLKAELNGNPNPGSFQIGGKPILARKPLDPNSPQAKAINAKIAANDHAIEEAKNRNAKSKENLDYQKQEMLRQEMVTWEQVGRGIESLANAASSINEGVFTQKIKNIDAELALIRSYQDILKTYSQSISTAYSTSQQAATDAAKAMEQYFQSRTQAFWAVMA